MSIRTSRCMPRREFLGRSVVGTLGLALSPAVQRALAADGPARRAKACVLVWLNGGPSHIDTFDPKPGAETNGPFKAIATNLPSVQFSEHLPKLAQQAHRLAVVRSLTSSEADHDRASRLLHTGHVPSETVDYPALGSVVAHEWSADNGDLPAYVSIFGSDPGAGFLGVDFASYSMPDTDTPPANVNLPQGVSDARMRRRLTALDNLNKSFAAASDPARVAERDRLRTRALRFRTSPALPAFDLTQEKPETLARYGAPQAPADGQDVTFGKACVLARRLVEAGVRFVEITLDGWDTHVDNFNQVAALCKRLDSGLAALIDDLAQRRLLEQTLVLCLGEFGRTPTINGDNGRDHWSDAFSLVAAGGGIRGGAVIGSSDAKGEKVKDRPVTVPDLHATLLTACGISPTKIYSVGGRPIKLADKGAVVKELFA